MKTNSTALKKTNPSDLPVEYLKQLRIERFGQDWVKYCDGAFEGGYNAVHKRLSQDTFKKGVHKATFNTAKANVVATCPVCHKADPVERSLSVLTKGIRVLTWKQRSFLCSVISYGRSSLTDKQEIWLSALEAKVN